MTNPPFDFSPLVSDGERAIITLQMARVAYQKWAELSDIVPDWDALPLEEKGKWVQVVRISTRAMLSLVSHILTNGSQKIEQV